MSFSEHLKRKFRFHPNRRVWKAELEQHLLRSFDRSNIAEKLEPHQTSQCKWRVCKYWGAFLWLLGWSNIAEKPESHHPPSTLSLLHEALILQLMQQIVELKSTRAQSRWRGAASAPCAPSPSVVGRGPPFKYVTILWILCIGSNLCIGDVTLQYI